MLVLTRKCDTVIKIGNNVVIRVLKTSSGAVKLGIEAPDDVLILRGELHPFGDEPATSLRVDEAHPLLGCE